MIKKMCGPLMNYIRSKKLIAVISALMALSMLGLSCDNVGLYNFAKDISGYGPKWSFDDPSITVTISFPENVINATNTANYRILNFTGDGSINISASYGDTNGIVNLALSISGTTISSFNVELVSSEDNLGNDTSIMTEEGFVFDGYTSPSFYPGCFYGCITP